MQHSDKTLASYVEKQCNIQTNTLATYIEKKTDETLRTGACNICLQPLQHPDLLLQKQLQHTSETFETYACNMQFSANISLLLGRMEARRYIEFAGGSRLTVLVGSNPAVATRQGRDAAAAAA
jgi:hypothetical protein